MLNTLEFGDERPNTPPALIVHGLYGSARNWGVIARRLASDTRVIAVDMRNHGQSPHRDTHSYHDMAQDLADVIDAHGGQASVIGHSMGGKAAMVLALTQPDKVARLMVADIAPVTYTHSQLPVAHAMQSVPLDQITDRASADAALAPYIDDPTLRSFLLQSLDVRGKRWKLNLDVLVAEMPKIMSFPKITSTYTGRTLFLSGGDSDYVTQDHRSEITTLFPRARFAKLPGAGHWLNAEKPREFEATVRAFLKA